MAWKAYNAFLADPKLLVLDSRSARSYADRHIRGSINVEVKGRTLEKIAGPDRPSWKRHCWWDRNVFVIPAVASKVTERGSKKRKSHVLDDRGTSRCRWTEDEAVPEEEDPVVAFLRRDKNVRSVRVLESDDDGVDPFRSFAKRYPFLVTKSTKSASIAGYPAEIVPGLLYLGDQEHAMAEKKLEELEITHVLTIHTDRLKIGKQFLQLYCNLADDPKADIAQFFDQAYEFVEDAKEKGERVLIHCGAGASRSASLVAAYLMRVRNWRLDRTLEYLREQRRQVLPNPGFIDALERYEKELGGQRALKRPENPAASDRYSESPSPSRGLHLEIVKNGEVCGTVLLSDKNMFLIGRAKTCHIVLDHASISRQHAKIEIREGHTVMLTDMDSVHGIFVDGKQLARGTTVELRLGQIIRFGASTRSYVMRD